MKLKTLLACAVLCVGVASAVPLTVATFNTSSNLNWGGCSVSCSIPVTFTYDGVFNNAPFNGPLSGTLTYHWAPVGAVTVNGSDYSQNVYADLAFSFTPPGKPTANLLTVDFTAAKGTLLYESALGVLMFGLTPTTSGGVAPIVTSSILNLPSTITDWEFLVSFGSVSSPGYVVGGNIKNFSHTATGWYGSTPNGAGQIPEPASMLMAGAGLLAIGGLLRMKSRLKK